MANPNWDKISWGKCKHAYLVEAFKQLYANGKSATPSELRGAEIMAEGWADMSMRALADAQAQKSDKDMLEEIANKKINELF